MSHMSELDIARSNGDLDDLMTEINQQRGAQTMNASIRYDDQPFIELDEEEIDKLVHQRGAQTMTTLSEKYLRIARGLGAHDADCIRYRLNNEQDLSLRANAAYNAMIDTIRTLTDTKIHDQIQVAGIHYRNDVLTGYGYELNPKTLTWESPEVTL